MGHERLAATTSRLGKRGLAGCEITARCTRVTTGSKATTACVAKTRLAAITLAVTAWGKTTIAAAIVAACKTAALTTGRCAAIVTPGKTPAPLLDRWNREIVKVLSDAGVKEALMHHGLTPQPTTRAEFAAFMRKEYDQWGAIARARKLTAE